MKLYNGRPEDCSGREERENYNIEKFWETKRREGES